MFMRIGVIATNTLRETIRQRLFLNILVFGLGMIVFAMVVGNITFGFPDRVVRSIGLSGVGIACNLLAILVGVGLVHGEIDRKTLFVVLTRPVERWAYVAGRYLGLLAALTLVLAGFALAYVAMLLYVAGAPGLRDFAALGMALVEASVLGGFALVLSSFSTPSLSAGIGLGFWIACASTDDLVGLTEKADPATRGLARAIAFALPSFARFDFREQAVYPFLELSPADVAFAAGYGLLYVLAFGALAGAILSRREMI